MYQLDDSKQGAPRFCMRCGAPIDGPFCSRCGSQACNASPPQAGEPYRAAWVKPASKGSGLAFALLLLSLCGVVLLISLLPFLLQNRNLLAAQNYSYAQESSEEHYNGWPEEDYSDYGVNFSYTNENDYMRVEALGTQRSAGSFDFPAPEGKEYLLVNLRITNLDEETIIPYETSEFELECGNQGNLLPSLPEAQIDGSTTLGHGRLLPNGSVEGTVAFLIPKGEINLVLYRCEPGNMILFPLV